MAKVLHIHWEETNFCRLDHPYNKRFVDWLGKGVRPTSYRRYESGHWYVHTKRLPQVVAMGRRYFGHVDYSSLPELMQIQLVKQLEGFNSTTTTLSPSAVGPHAVLFVLEGAPWEVIEAAYKALALKTHPDRGGRTEDFQKVQRAFEELKTALKG
jgi:hypothetical protein